MNCQCTKPLVCACPQKYSVKLGDFDSSTTVPGHGLRIEPHQMILRYASVLTLGTTGYRAPEVGVCSNILVHIKCTCIGIHASGDLWTV